MAHFLTQPIFSPDMAPPMSHCATLIALPGGELLAAWFTGAFETAPDQFIAVARRSPGAEVWSQPIPAVDTPGQADGQPVFLLDGQGVLWLYFVTLSGPDWTSAHMRRRPSLDLGRTWGPVEELPLPPGMMFRSRPLNFAFQGEPERWLFPVYDEVIWRSTMLISEDDGASWRRTGFIETPNGNIHPCVAPLADGRLLAFLRPGGQGGVIWRTVSQDRGESWALPVPTPLPNPNSGLDLLATEQGSLLLAFNNSRRRRTPLCVALSDDQGASWPHLRVLEDGEGEFSYPTVIQGADGIFHAVYTWRRRTIQYVQFDEAWLRQGPAWKGAVA